MARKTASRRRVAAQDSLSNLAASLGAGKDKAASDAFFVADLARDQIEAMYRGDWLARKVVDIVPYDSIREWRSWAGEPAAVAAIQGAEQRLGLRKAVQRAMTLGRLYGGGAILIGTAEEDPAALAAPLHPEAIGPGGVRFLHAVSRWQLDALDLIRDPLDPFFGEPTGYRVVGPDRGELLLHPSRVVRFLGNPLPDPLLYGSQLWSDSVLQSLYDAIHAVALTHAGATSLVHEAKVDIVTVPGLSEHLSNAATTAQLSARFGYAATMKSINNLLLLGDGETWTRQSIDFAGLPEMVRTVLQVAAGAADIPVTRLLGQSPAGLSATGDSDTRNYYDMIAARQELDLRPGLERLDALVLRSAGVDPAALRFSFRPLWQMGASEAAQVALAKAQTTAVYAGLSLWPAATTAALVRSQLMEDGVYPGVAAALDFETPAAVPTSGRTAPGGAGRTIVDFDPDQPRDPQGRWTGGGGQPSSPVTTVDPATSGPRASRSSEVGALSRIGSPLKPTGTALAQGTDPESENRGLAEELVDPTAEVRIERYYSEMDRLRTIDPSNPELVTLTPPNYIPSNADIERVQASAEAASIQRVKDFIIPNGQPIGLPGTDPTIREVPGGLAAAERDFGYLTVGGIPRPFSKGTIVQLPGNAGFVVMRPRSSSPNSPAIDINVAGVPYRKLHY